MTEVVANTAASLQQALAPKGNCEALVLPVQTRKRILKQQQWQDDRAAHRQQMP